MKVLIAGSRTITSAALLERVLSATRIPISEVVSGGAPGVDTLAYHYAMQRELPCHVYPAKWRTGSKKAGPLRNALMLAEQMPERGVILRLADAARSPGSLDMQAKLLRAKVPTFVALVQEDGTLGDCLWYDDFGPEPLF